MYYFINFLVFVEFLLFLWFLLFPRQNEIERKLPAFSIRSSLYFIARVP